MIGLPRYWYVACLSSELGHRPLARVVLDTPMALFRDGAGNQWALLDRCPHRNVPLSPGRVRDGELDVFGPHIRRLLGQAEKPEAATVAGAEHRIRMRV